jgi:hypothetical protein
MIFICGSIVGPQVPLAIGKYFVAYTFRFYSASMFLGFISSFGLILFDFLLCLLVRSYYFHNIHTCSYTEMGCPSIEMTHPDGRNLSEAPVPFHLRIEPYPGSDTMCFFCGVGLKPPLGPFFRSPRFRFLRSLCSSPLGPYKSQHCGHTLAYCAFPGWYMRVIVE